MSTPNRTRTRRGVITLEFILVLPMIILITWGTFQFAILFLVVGGVSSVSGSSASASLEVS